MAMIGWLDNPSGQPGWCDPGPSEDLNEEFEPSDADEAAVFDAYPEPMRKQAIREVVFMRWIRHGEMSASSAEYAAMAVADYRAGASAYRAIEGGSP